MTNLLWPGDERAGDLMTDLAVLEAMVAVEAAWLGALVAFDVIPSVDAGLDLASTVTATDCDAIALAAEDSANPVVELVAVLRQRAPADARRWIHRGLTSQDVLDTALSLTLRAALNALEDQLLQQISLLCTLAEDHRRTPMIGRTLTQHAVPITFAAKVAAWLTGVLDAYERLRTVATPIQIGGAAGTLAASTELVRLRRLPGDPAEISVALVRHTADVLGLPFRPPWHTSRSVVTTAADALVSCTDAWGRIASDVLTLSRPEVGELTESTGDGRGGSSTMPHKRNPVLSVLIRRAAIAVPPLAATLHTAAALANDERPDGAWHAEWDTERVLARRVVVAGSQCTDLLHGLQVHPDRMAEHVDNDAGLSEQRAIAEVAGAAPSPTYDGATDLLVDIVIERAHDVLKDLP